ncbi:MAG: hypothetical protein WA964_20175 [Ilumatobacter sp.]|uniref:hypothetical protein n=1 Tax=Ilumatobacter sp. TaxID=1967498 RepID=UPI003C75CC54
MFTGIVEELGEVAERDGSRLRVTAPRIRVGHAMTRYIVEKGSITVDGISLTVVGALDDGFTVAIIPHTEAVKKLAFKDPGDRADIEVDVTATYIEKLISWRGDANPADSETAGDAS